MAAGWDFQAVMPRLTERAVEWIGQQRENPTPFFLYFPFTSPHAPIVPAPEFVGRSQAWGYGDYVAQTDATVDFDDAPGLFEPSRELQATVAWLDDEPLVAGRVYWALHGHAWVKAKIKRIVHKLDINTLVEEDASQLETNAIGHIELTLQQAIAALPYSRSRVLGSLILVDTASHKTAGAVLIN